MSAREPQRDRTGRSFPGPATFAAAVVALGVVVLAGTPWIPSRSGYAPVGPRFFPLAVALGLLVLGALLLVRCTLRPDAYLGEKAASEKAATHWPTVGLLLAALLVYGFLLAPLGYVPATALFFPAAAWVLGSRRPREAIRNLAIGLVVGAVVFFGFTELLGVRLPDGLLDPFL